MFKFTCQLSPHTFTSCMDIDPLNIGVRAGKVDILHRANSQLGVRCIVIVSDAVIIDDHDFTWIHIADPLSTNHFKGTGFRGNYDSAIGHFPNRKRTETIWIQGRNQLIFQHEKVSKSTFHRIQGFFHLTHERRVVAPTNQVGQDF